MTSIIRLAYFVSHPIQYQAPLLRLIAAQPGIKLKVFFYSDFSVVGYQDRGFNRLIKWDIPLVEGYDYHFLNCLGSKKYKNFLIARNILEELRIGKFDAVWVHGWSDICSLQAVVAAKKLRIPVLIRGESNGLKEPRYFIKQLAKKAFLSWLFNHIFGVLYIGKLNRQFYKSLGVSDKSLFLMPYAVDNDYFQKKALLTRTAKEEFRKALNLKPTRPIILYAAKLTEKKRPQDLLAAYRLLSSDGLQEPEPYLLFVGDGAMRSQLESEAEATGWQSIRFLGFRNQSEMPAMYELCDVFVLPSSFEPWGLAVNEVMNSGKAVVVSEQVGCAPDLVLEGQNGCIFPVGDIVALAKAIQWAITNRLRLGDISFKHIQNWSFRQDVEGLKLALDKISNH